MFDQCITAGCSVRPCLLEPVVCCCAHRWCTNNENSTAKNVGPAGDSYEEVWAPRKEWKRRTMISLGFRHTLQPCGISVPAGWVVLRHCTQPSSILKRGWHIFTCLLSFGRGTSPQIYADSVDPVFGILTDVCLHVSEHGLASFGSDRLLCLRSLVSTNIGKPLRVGDTQNAKRKKSS
jgi:hypothetical protein